jgi:hypothetical protein
MGRIAEFGGVWRYVSDSIKDPLETFQTETVQFSNVIARLFDDAEATIVWSDRLVPGGCRIMREATFWARFVGSVGKSIHLDGGVWIGIGHCELC